MDFNVQVDVRSAQHVFEHGRPSLVPMTVTVETSLRRAYLPALRASGPLGALIARQAEAFAEDWENETRLALASPGLPDDTINFQHDPLACAIALGWRDGAEVSEVPLRFEVRDGLMHEVVDPHGRPTSVVTRIDGTRFSDFWVQRVTGG
jgi:inosine-uridine nucleoside N-ribohydrolase